MAKCGFDGCKNEAGETKLTGSVAGISDGDSEINVTFELGICDEHAAIVNRGVATSLSIGAQFEPAYDASTA